MKNLKKIISSVLILSFIIAIMVSCEKENYTKNKTETTVFDIKSAPSAPSGPSTNESIAIRHLTLNDYLPNHENGPFPYAHCNFMGSNCAFEVVIRGEAYGGYQGENYDEYLQYVDLLDNFIAEENTAEFFLNYDEGVYLLLPEFYNPENQQYLDMLREGVLTVVKYTKTLESNENVYGYEFVSVE